MICTAHQILFRSCKRGRRRWVGHVGRPEGMRPPGRFRRRRDDNIKTDFKKWDGEEWIGLLRLRIGTCDGRL